MLKVITSDMTNCRKNKPKNDQSGWIVSLNSTLVALSFAVFIGCWSILATARACPTNPSDPSSEANSYDGKIVGFATAEQISKRTRAVELKTGWSVSASYANWPRIIAQVNEGHGHFVETLAAYPSGQILKIGEDVRVVSRHRDLSHACHFIPWIVEQTDLTS